LGRETKKSATIYQKSQVRAVAKSDFRSPEESPKGMSDLIYLQIYLALFTIEKKIDFDINTDNIYIPKI